jgi:hypothetical protein
MASKKSRVEELEEFRKAFKTDHPFTQPSCCGSSQNSGSFQNCGDGSCSELSDESEVEDYQYDGSDDEVNSR